MGIYLINFLVYSMAMVGLLFLGVTVYKKTMVTGRCKNDTNELAVENALNLSPRKTLYVVKAGNEKFLIAADAERTSFLAKLDEKEPMSIVPVQPLQAERKQEQPSADYSEVMSAIKTARRKQPVMREILRKLDERAEMADRAASGND